LTVNSISGASRWIKVLFPSGELVKTPLAVSSGGSLVIEAALEPNGLFGRVHLPIEFECTHAGETLALTTEIDVHVAAGLRAFPESVMLADVDPDTPLQSVIDLFDAYPDQGIHVAQFESSNPERLQVESVAEFERTVLPAMIDGMSNPRQDFRHRYRLKLTYRTPQEYGRWFDEHVSAIPENPDIPPFMIPVTGRTRAPDYDMSPNRLIVAVSHDATVVQRRLKCRVAEGLPSDLRVLQAPDFVKAVVTAAPDGAYLDTQIAGPTNVKQLKGEIELGVGESGAAVISVPVTVFRLPASLVPAQP
jgi:hypothetical protein